MIAKELELSPASIAGYLKKEIPSAKGVQSAVHYLGYPLRQAQGDLPLEVIERGLVERKGGKGEGEDPGGNLSTGLFALDRNLYAANLSFQRGDKASPF